MDLFARTGVGRDPSVVRMFAKIEDQLIEHGAVLADPVGPIGADEAQEQLASVRKELLTVPQGSQRAKELIARIVALSKIATRTAA